MASILLFVSGASALVFQVAWMRELRLVFGATTAAVAAVLAVFMAGLGIGSAVLGRRAEQSTSPLRLYGQLEAAVALAVAASPFLISLTARLYFHLGGQEALGTVGATAVRLALTAAVIGLPTFLMGGTLPAAARSITAIGDVRRRSLAILYGINTLGAVCGAYFATFYALENLGTRATLWFGCAMNFLIGVVAINRAKRAPLLADLTTGVSGGTADGSPQSPWLIYLAATLLGFIFFTLELVWYRMLGPILGGTTFTFGLILCIALLGIGIGGAAYNVVFRYLRPSWSALAITCALEAALAALPLALGDRIALFAVAWAQQVTTFYGVIAGWCLVMSIVVFPVALVSGIQFPLLIALLGQGRAGVSRQLGSAYAWNTLGAIAGSLIGGFGALPLFTAPGVWRGMTILLSAMAAVFAFRAGRTARGPLIAVAALIALTIAFNLQTGPTAVWRHSGIGAGRAAVPPATNVNAVKMWCNEQRRNLKWEAEGIESSIGISAPEGLSFVVNGKVDGNAVGDAGTQIGMAIIGGLLHPDPRTGLVIGLGTGESAGWLAAMPGMERVDVVELEPQIDEVARRAAALNRHALENPRIRRIYNDGREHIFTTDEKYDVILSEPSNPYRAGVASLYTVEFYEAARQRLTPNGIFVQWMQAYEVDEYTVKTVLATARRVFDHVEIWQTIPGDFQIVCSQQPIVYSLESLQRRIDDPVVHEALNVAWHVEGLEGFLSHFFANATYVDSIADQPIFLPNLDDRNFLEYGFAKTVGLLTGFSAGSLRNQVVELGLHRPPISTGVDWDLLDKYRTEFVWLFDGDFNSMPKESKDQRARAAGYIYFANGSNREAVDKWAEISAPELSDVDRLVRAWAHAELAESAALELIAPLAEKFPTETSTIRATYYWNKQDKQQSATAVSDVFAALKTSPWAIAGFTHPAMGLAAKVSVANPEVARRLYDQLAEPFPGYRFEHQRMLLRLLLAEELGQDDLLNALTDLEPDTPWMPDLLELRAKTYRAANHPLADVAERDWRQYQLHQSPDAPPPSARPGQAQGH